MKWLKTIMSRDDEASHKRLISLGSWIILIGMVVLNCFGIKIMDQLIYVFAGLTAGNTTLTVLEKFIDNDKK